MTSRSPFQPRPSCVSVLKESELGLRDRSSVHSCFLSDECRQLECHKTGKGQAAKFRNAWFDTSRVYALAIKRDQVCEIYKALHSKQNVGEVILEMPFLTLRLSWQGDQFFKTGGTSWSKNIVKKWKSKAGEVNLLSTEQEGG